MIFKTRNYIFRIILQCIKYLDFYSIMKLRNYLYKFILYKMGNSCNICAAVTLISPQNIEVGDKVSIHHNCYIGGRGKIKIGDYVSIANGSIIISEEHNYNDLEKRIKEQGITEKNIIIEDNVWIGANVKILGGVTIKTGSIIAAGAVVNSDTSENSIFGGVPARFIKSR